MYQYRLEVSKIDKIKYIESNCEINHDEDGYYVDTGGIVGNFASRAIYGNTQEEAVLNTMNYLHNERYSDKDTIVKGVLKNIGW